MKIKFKKLTHFIVLIVLNVFFAIFTCKAQINTDSGIKPDISSTFSKEELKNAIDKSTKEILKDDNLEESLKTFAEKLSDYKVTGYSFCVYPNMAFVLNTQTPSFKVTYKNSEGKTKTRTYKASLKSIGFKFEFTFKINLIFFIGTDLNFYNTNKEIIIPYGIDINSAVLDITFAKFDDIPGGMLILGIPFPQVLINGPKLLNAITDYPNFLRELKKEVQKEAKWTSYNSNYSLQQITNIYTKAAENILVQLYLLNTGISLITEGFLIPTSET